MKENGKAPGGKRARARGRSTAGRDTVHGPVPAIVEGVLAQWDGLAFFAYEGFAKEGRGVVALDPGEGDTGIFFVARGFFAERDDPAVLALIDAYDPDWEIVLYFENAPGVARAIRVRATPRARPPKRVYFFEMLRRLNEEPATLPEVLPTWFVEACDRLGRAMRRRARGRKASRQEARSGVGRKTARRGCGL